MNISFNYRFRLLDSKFLIFGFSVIAGKATFIVNNADLRRLIDDVHYDVFKMNREERKSRVLTAK